MGDDRADAWQGKGGAEGNGVVVAADCHRLFNLTFIGSKRNRNVTEEVFVTHSDRNEAIKKAIRAHSRKALVDQTSARKSLVDSGIYTAAGDLHPNYGGPAVKREA